MSSEQIRANSTSAPPLAPYGLAPRKEGRELQADVARPRAIPILWQLAVLILANAQATNSFVAVHPPGKDGLHLGLHVDPRTAGVEASAARLRRALFRG
jgi:hypothetical protein